MEKSEKTKILGFALAALIIVMSLFDIDVSIFALSADNYPVGNITYHFFHVNAFHAIANAWCLLGLVFLYNVRTSDLIIAFSVAASFPIQLCSAPSVGLSGLLYALMGLVFPNVRNQLCFLACIFSWNCVALVVGGFGVEVHAYCFAVALLNWYLYKWIFKL